MVLCPTHSSRLLSGLVPTLHRWSSNRSLFSHNRCPGVLFDQWPSSATYTLDLSLQTLHPLLLGPQPFRLSNWLRPMFAEARNRTNTSSLYAARAFQIEGFSALALRELFPTCGVMVKLGAIAMPRAVFAALLATAELGQCNIHLIHAEDDDLCDWHPSPTDLYVILHRFKCTLVAESARWMGASKHQYWH